MLLARNGGSRNLQAIMQYVHERTRFRRRWIGALERLTDPALIGWGKKDPVCALAIAKQLAKELRAPSSELRAPSSGSGMISDTTRRWSHPTSSPTR